MGGLILLAIALAAAGVWMTRAQRADDCTPPTAAEREAMYARRVDASVGLHSDAHLQRVARGIAIKRAQLAALQRICFQRSAVPACQSLVPAGPVRVRFTGRRRRHLRAVA